jgi:hypothetical protein
MFITLSRPITKTTAIEDIKDAFFTKTPDTFYKNLRHRHSTMEYHPFTIHLADRSGNIVKTYHPATANESVCITRDDIKGFDTELHAPYIDISIARGKVTMEEGATWTYTYQPEFYPDCSVCGSSKTGVKLCAIDVKTGNVGDEIYSESRPIYGDFDITSDGKIATTPQNVTTPKTVKDKINSRYAIPRNLTSTPKLHEL